MALGHHVTFFWVQVEAQEIYSRISRLADDRQRCDEVREDHGSLLPVSASSKSSATASKDHKPWTDPPLRIQLRSPQTKSATDLGDCAYATAQQARLPEDLKGQRCDADATTLFTTDPDVSPSRSSGSRGPPGKSPSKLKLILV